MQYLMPLGWVSLMFLLGLGYREYVSVLFGLSAVLLWLVWRLWRGESLSYPKLYWGYVVFVGVLMMSTWWSQHQLNSLQHWLLFASMPAVWVWAVSNRAWLAKHLSGMMVVLGFLYLFMTGLTQVVWEVSSLKTTPRGLVGAFSANADHFMVGDFWALLLVLAVYRYIRTRRLEWLGLVGSAVLVVIFSLSRSALLGAAVGLWLLFEKMEGVSARARKIAGWIFVFGVVYMSMHKSILLNRPYYVQAIAGLFEYPFGVGLGNFELISQDSRFWWLGMSGFSRMTHSVLLEFMAAMGVLVVVFWRWCWRIYQVYLVDKPLNEHWLMLVVLAVNMLFNPTYFVPAMWWLLPMLLVVVDGSRETRGGKWRGVALWGLSGLALLGGLLVGI